MKKYCVIYSFIIFLHYGTACWLNRPSRTQICSTVEEVPKEATNAWKKLRVLSSSNITRDTFKNVPNLISLECHNIESMEEGTFSSLNKLEELSLYNVKLAEIPLRVLENASVKKLTISESDLKFIQPGLFRNMPEIEMLDLSNNSIVEIQKGVFDNSKIQMLTLANNKIVNIAGKAFENMNSLTTLNLENNLIDSFDSEQHIGTSDSLETLYLSKNKLSKVTKNMFKTIPHLIQLYLLINNIETIELNSFKNLTELELITFHINNINEVQKGIFDNTNIIELYLGNNRIDKIADKAFENMPKLTHLSFRGNLLKSFNAELYLGPSSSLSTLWLANNFFTTITSNMFTSIFNLKELYLELNQIKSIEAGTFYRTPFLKFLDLSNNNLRSLNLNIFPQSGMDRLLLLALHNNQLTFLNKALFYRIPNLRYITYAGNPFQCPCHHELTKIIREKRIFRICDRDYLEGERPVCAFSSIAPQECLYDEEMADDLYLLYNRAIRDYPKLELKCDISTGIEQGFLNKFEEVNPDNRLVG